MFTQKIKEHQNVNYLGLVSDTENYISSAKLVWCLSKGEGQSLAMLESLEKGKPIISTNNQAAEDLVINNQNGYLIKDELITSFIKHTEDLLSNEKNMQASLVFQKNCLNQNFQMKSLIKI